MSFFTASSNNLFFKLPQGQKGDRGVSGLDGLNGEPGQKGETGSTGSKGEPGDAVSNTTWYSSNTGLATKYEHLTGDFLHLFCPNI